MRTVNSLEPDFFLQTLSELEAMRDQMAISDDLTEDDYQNICLEMTILKNAIIDDHRYVLAAPVIEEIWAIVRSKMSN